MMSSPKRRSYRGFALGFVPAMIAWVLASHCQAGESVFTALGIEPARFGEAWVQRPPQMPPPPVPWQYDSEPDPFALAVLPSTPAERQQLLDGMMTPRQALSPSQRLSIAHLLEGWGRTDDALALLEAKGAADVDLFHLVRLRYRNGDLGGAASALVAAQDPDRPAEPGFQGLYRRSAGLVRPFVAMDQYPELAKFLEWIQPRCQSTSLRGEILALRLTVACTAGKSTELLDQLRREPSVMRQVADWLMTRDPTKLPPAMDDLPPGDLALLYRMAGEAPAVMAAIHKLVTDGRGAPGERIDLFLQFIDRPPPDRDALLENWLTHDETCLPVLSATLAQLATPNSVRLPAEPLMALADRHPDHLPTNLLAGLTARANRRAFGGTTERHADPSDKFLQRAMQAPLLADAVGEFVDSGSLLPRPPTDIAGIALAALATTTEPRDLLEMLTKHRGFNDLPVRARARYLAIAKLDVPFVETMLTLDWTDPANDRCGNWIVRHLESNPDRKIPADALWERLLAAWPAMLAGSREKSEARIRSDTVQLDSLLSRIQPNNTGIAGVLAALRERLDGNARAMVEGLMDKRRERRPVSRPDLMSNPADRADPMNVLRWFAPARLVRWVDMANPEEIIRPGLGRNGDSRGPLGVMTRRYPVLDFRAMRYFPMQGLDPEVLGKLRRLLPAQSPHAMAFDLAVTGHQLPAPAEDLAAIAKRHVAAALEHPQELDFILCKMLMTRQPVQPEDGSGFAVLTTAPARVRMSVAAALDGLAGPDSAMPQVASLRKKLLQGIMIPQYSNPAQDEDRAAYDHLQHFRQLGEEAGPEAGELARKVLRGYLARGARTTSPTENVAIIILVKAGDFEPFLKEIAAEYRSQPGGELACAKAMHALHQYAIIHSHGESATFAKRVLELDPDDVPAAEECANLALTAGDISSLLAALPALRKGDPSAFLEIISSARALAILPPDAAPRLLEILALSTRPVPAGIETGRGRTYNVAPQQLEALHQFFNEADSLFGERYRKLILATGWFSADVMIPALVNSLVKADRRQEAVALLIFLITDCGQTPPADFKLRFPATPAPVFELSRNHLSAFKCAVSTSLCKDLLDRLSATPGADVPADLLAMLRFAVTPTAEVFAANVRPLLYPLEKSKRKQASQRLVTALAGEAGTEGCKKMLDDDEYAANPEPTDLDELGRQARRCLASKDLAKLRGLWQQCRKILPAQSIRNEWMLFPMAEVMVEVADDALWADYFAELLETIPKTRNLIHLAQYLSSFGRPSLQPRLAPLLRAVATAMTTQDYNLEMIAKDIAAGAWLSDDSATLHFLAEHLQRLPDKRITPGIRNLLADIRLVEGDPEIALPVIWARPAADGKWTILWSLAGVNADLGSGRTCLGIDPKALDGVFDLTILAAPDSTRFKQIQTITQAKASGTVLVTLPEGTTTLGLTATQLATKAVLQTAPLALNLAKRPAFELTLRPESRAGNQEIRKLPSPFGSAEPVIGLGLSPGRVIELAALPWQPGKSLDLGAWVLSNGRAQLQVQALDQDGKVVGSQAFAGDGGRGSLPRWWCVHLKLESRYAAAAEKLVLVAACDAKDTYHEASPLVWIADFRLETVAESAPSAAAERVGRIPGEISAMSCDPTGASVAAGLQDGRVIVLDTKTARTRNFQPCPGTGIFFVGMGGRHVVAIDASRMVHVMDLDSGLARKLGRVNFQEVNRMRPAFALSPDGEWLAWTGMMVDVLVARLGPEQVGKPLALPVGASPELTMDTGGAAILASGSRHHFKVPISALCTLDPAKLEALAEKPRPKSAARHDSRNGSSWLDPIHAIRISGASGTLVFSPAERLLTVPATALAVTPEGIVFFTTPSGTVYRLDPTKVDGYTPPAVAPELPEDP